MHVKPGNSRFFPVNDDPDGLGWTVRDESKLQKLSGYYSHRHAKESGNKVVFDATYTFDNLYRRVVPGQPQRTDKFLVFFGGSQTFGEGLDDSDTIPAYVQQYAPSYRVYNYAYRGYGPHQMLKKLEMRNLRNELQESRGIAFFQYFSFHAPRVLGTMHYLSWAGAGAPYYRLNTQGQLEYAGSFASGRFFQTWLYWVMGKSAILKYFNVDLPAQLTNTDYDLVCETIKESRDKFLDQFPESRFIVIIGMTSAKKDSFIEQCLETGSIESVDLRAQFRADEGLTIENDGHFTPKATRLTAESLLPVLEQ